LLANQVEQTFANSPLTFWIKEKCSEFRTIDINGQLEAAARTEVKFNHESTPMLKLPTSEQAGG